jgi:hypothetical protein
MPLPRKRIPQSKNSSLIVRGLALNVPDSMPPTNAVVRRALGSPRLREFLTARHPPFSFSGVIITECHDDVCMTMARRRECES